MIMNSQLVMMSKDLMQAIHDSQIYIAIFFICMLLTATANWWWRRLRQFPRMPFPPSVAEEDRISESSYSSKPSSSSKYQVFLSFRGPDTRQGFTDILFVTLKDAGVRIFRDNNELRVGHEIGEDLMKAIRDSQIYIPIFSKNYARSKWCLWELTEMVEVTRESKDKEIIPIFYDVTTDDVKRENGLYDTAMKALGQDREVIQQCKDALREVCKIKGWELKDMGYGEFCKSIVREISIKLRVKHKPVTDCLIGMDGQVKALMNLLNMESDGVKAVGIHGMGGIGKTTLAKVVFNQLSSSFDACSFISDVREKSNSRGLVHLQKQLLKDIGGNVEIDDENDGVNSIKTVSRLKRVLIVLDDVSQREQIENLAGASNWFGAKSRIIITTRDKRNLEIEGQEIKPFEKEDLDDVQALELFSLHAFGKHIPPEDYLPLSKEVVSFTGRLPLALEIIGSLLNGKKYWRNMIEELKVIPLEDVQKKLRISYDSLDSWEKQIFLDIACLFDGEKMTNPIYMWDACGFHPESKVDVLVSMSLIKIKDDKFWMHDQLKDLGREIVRAENLEYPEKHSRIWKEKEALRILKDIKKGRGKIKVICQQHEKPFCSMEDGSTFTHEELGGLENLRFLQLPKHSQIAGNLQDCLPNLRWFSCNSVMKATNLSMKRLVILELMESDVSECWNGWNQLKGMDTLKVLDLTGSSRLRKTPDLSGCKSLERLILCHCKNLIEIDPSIANLKALKYLDLDCTDITELPSSIGGLVKLERLSLKWCPRLASLLESVQNLKSLVELDLKGTDITELPSTIGGLVKLERLSLKWCPRLASLPESVQNLKSLVELSLDDTDITKLPSAIGGLVHLERLSLCGCSRLASLPESVQNLKSLVELSLDGTDITELPSTIGGLVKLERLSLKWCPRLASLPESVQNLKSLVELSLDDTDITELPSAIGGLVHLERLSLCGCSRLASLPESVQNLKSLVELSLDRTDITELPSTIGGLVKLERLSLKWCPRLASLPESVQNLKSLVELYLNNTGITELPSAIGGLVHLERLSLCGCSRLASLPESVQNLKSLVELSLDRTDITELPSTIGVLVKLEILSLCWCSRLASLPESVQNLKSLVELSLDGTDITELPSAIGGLVHLERLSLKWCPRLASLPESVQNLKSLVELSLDDTDITELPSAIGGLVHLERLSLCECCRLASLPESVQNLKSLVELSLDGTDITELPSTIGGLVKLERLSLKWCPRLASLPESVQNLKSLVLVQNLKSLVELELSGSGITNIPNSCARLDAELSECLFGKNGDPASLEPESDVSTLTKQQHKEELAVEDTDSEGASGLTVDTHLVGMEKQVKAVTELLDIDSGGVLFVGIYGIGGIGKTTLAKVVFNQLSTHFQGCSFVRDIRENSKCKGVQYLQHQLLSDFTSTTTNDEIETMKDKFFNKRIIIVLDDVDQRDQVKKLVGKSGWFGSGSRIIITTRNQNLMATEHERFGNYEVLYHEMRPMEHGLALQLFSRHALGEDSPSNPENARICEEIVYATGRLPLALEIIGSYLRHQNKQVWESTSIHLKEMHDGEFEEKLKISYDALEHDTKQIFLDIACFFSDEGKTNPVYMWDACGYSPNQRIEVLRSLSLVKIEDDNKLWMHDRVREFGRRIVQGNAMDPVNCSRLWVHEEIVYILKEKQEETGNLKSKEVEAISVYDNDFPWDITLSHKELQSLPKLRYLKLCRFKFAGDFGSCLSELKWLSCHYSPSDFDATNLDMNCLVILDLSTSCITHQWGGWIHIRMENLKVLNLSHCKDLTSTPDLSGYTKLESLVLEGCVHLATVDTSIGKLKQLKHLNMKGCISLKGLPDELCGAESLEKIVVSRKGQSLQVPKGIGALTHLTTLVVSNAKMSSLPSDIGELKSLVELNLSGATIARLPSSIGMLMSLKELCLRSCEALKEIPDAIGDLNSLTVLDLSFTGVSLLPSSISQLSCLQTLNLESCNELQELPELPFSLVNLRVVSNKLRRIADLSPMKSTLTNLKLATRDEQPFALDWVRNLYKLKNLELCFPVITRLEFGEVAQLSSLHISTRNLQCLPAQLPSSLLRLFLAHIDVESMITNLSLSKKLTFLELHASSTSTSTTEECQVGFEELESVEHLSVHNCNLNSLPKKLRALYVRNCQFPNGELDLTGLKHLVHLEVTDCEELEKVQGVRELEALEEMNIWDCSSLESLDDLSELKHLEALSLDSCGKLKEVKGLDGKIKSLKQLGIFNCKSLKKRGTTVS